MFNSVFSFLTSLADGAPPFKFASILVFAMSSCAIAAVYYGTQHPEAIYLVIATSVVHVSGLLVLAKIAFKALREANTAKIVLAKADMLPEVEQEIVAPKIAKPRVSRKSKKVPPENGTLATSADPDP